MTEAYNDFLATKAMRSPSEGFEANSVNAALFPFQRQIVRWALAKGRAALFEDCGLGKSIQQLEWAKQVSEHAVGKVLILAPLAVAGQTVREADRFGYHAVYRKTAAEIGDEPIVVTNYERLGAFLPWAGVGVVIDESGILKSYDGATRTLITESFRDTRYKLACTATPAPNDFMELGNHAEFLGVMRREEMLATFFTHDGGDTAKWRLKGHAEKEFWRWVCGWAVMIRKPSDLGYEDGAFTLPALTLEQHMVAADHDTAKDRGMLFNLEAQTLGERRDARRATIAQRVKLAAEIVEKSWIESKSKHTTKPTDSRTGTRSSLVEKSGTKKTLSESAPAPESISRKSRQKSNVKKSAFIERSLATDFATICAADTQKNEKSLSPSIGEDGQSAPRLNGTGTSGPSTESHSNSMTPCLPCNVVDAPYAGAIQPTESVSLSTTVTPQVPSGGFYVVPATSESESSATAQSECRAQWIIWCNLNAEAEAMQSAIHGAVNVQGSDSAEQKERAILDFISGRTRVLVSKPSIFGYGLNLQNCSNVIFLGLSDSYESLYQSLRRVYRFGQTRPVVCHVVISELEGAVLLNIKRKEADATRMANEMVKHMSEIQNLNPTARMTIAYEPETKIAFPTWLRGGA